MKEILIVIGLVDGLKWLEGEIGLIVFCGIQVPRKVNFQEVKVFENISKSAEIRRAS